MPKLACIVNGEADYLLGKYSIHCGAGNFILIPPRAPHQTSGPFLSPGRISTGKCGLVQAYAFSHGVRLWCSYSQGERHVSNYADHYFLYDQNAADILHMLTTIAEEAKPNWNIVCGSLLTAFFSIVMQDIKDGLFTRQSRNPIENTATSSLENFASQVRAYINNNCHKPIKLPDAAAHFYMSVSQLTRRLRQEGNGSFVEMLTAARIEKAKQFLRETDITIITVAGNCGFFSEGHFRSLFARYAGCSPSEYRRQNAITPLAEGKTKE